MGFRVKVSDKRIGGDGTAKPTALNLLLKDKLPTWARVLISLAVIVAFYLFFVR